MPSLARRLINSIWPNGSAWNPSGSLDKFLDGLSDSIGTVIKDSSALKDIRRPRETSALDELEIDFGIVPDGSLTEDVRRERLFAKVNGSESSGAIDAIEREIATSGFSGISVYDNSPAVDPRLFSEVYEMVAGGGNAYAGDADAYAARYDYDVIVNGRIEAAAEIYEMVAGGENAYAGDADAYAGVIGITNIEYNYVPPIDSRNWPFMFFVGGSAVVDGSGRILSISPVDVPANRKEEIESLVLRLKPIHAWAILVINYV